MRHVKTLTISALVLALALLSFAARRSDSADWTTSYDQALAAAKSSKRLVLADFTGSDWCGYCIKLKKEVLDTPDFKSYAATRLVLLELDFPRGKTLPEDVKKQNAELKSKFNVKGFPTVVILDSTGQELGRLVGYGGKEKWSQQLQDILNKNQK